jgi:hypothetical protein
MFLVITPSWHVWGQKTPLYKLLDVTEVSCWTVLLHAEEEKTALMIEEVTLTERGTGQTELLFNDLTVTKFS